MGETKMKNLRKQITLTVIFAGITGMLLLLNAFAASSAGANLRIPSSVDPGAVLSREQQYFKLQQEQPFLFRPITIQDVTGTPEESSIIFEKGVLPSEREVQGILITPGGSILISPPSD